MMRQELRTHLSIFLISLWMINPLGARLGQLSGIGPSSQSNNIPILQPLQRNSEIDPDPSPGEYDPAIEITITGPETAMVGEEVIFLITVSNQIINKTIQEKDLAGDIKYQSKNQADISRLVKDFAQAEQIQRGKILQGDDIFLGAMMAVISAFLGLMIAWIINLIKPRSGNRILFLCVASGLLIGIGYWGVTRTGWELDWSSLSKQTRIPPPSTTHLEEETTPQVVTFGDGSPVHNVSLTNPEGKPIIYIEGDLNQNKYLDHGEYWIYEFHHTVKRSDPDLILYPIAFAALDEEGDLISLESSLTLEVVFQPGIKIQKTGPETADIGEEVAYGFTLINDAELGDGSPLSNVAVTDGIAGKANYVSGDFDDDGLLEIGESWVYTVTHTFESGIETALNRYVTVTGTDESGLHLTYEQEYFLALGYSPVLQMAIQNLDSPIIGQQFDLSIELTNDGVSGDGSPVSSLTVQDRTGKTAIYVSGDINSDGFLESGERWVYRFTHMASANDPDPLQITFTALGQDLDRNPVRLENSFLFEIEYHPVLTIQISGPDSAGVGDQVTLELLLENDTILGDGSSIKNLSISGPDEAVIRYLQGDINQNLRLDSNEKWLYETIFSINSEDPPDLVNNFEVKGNTQDGDPVTTDASYSLEVSFEPAINIQISPPEVSRIDDPVRVEITILNDAELGDGSPIQDVTVSDSDGQNVVFSKGDRGSDLVLEIDEIWIYTIDIVLSPDDPSIIEQGITVTGKDKNGDIVTTNADFSLKVDHQPAIQIQVSEQHSIQVGEPATLSFTVTHDLEAGDGSPLEEITTSNDSRGPIVYLEGDNNNNGLLEIGESWSFSTTIEIQANDPDSLDLTLTSAGVDLDGESVQASSKITLNKFYPFLNGNFERMAAGWNVLDSGLEASIIQSTPTGDQDIPIGLYAIRLGGTGYPCSPDGVPLGYAEINRKITIPQAPPGKQVLLRFNYVIYTQDVSTKPAYDGFEVYINENATPVFRDGNQVNTGLGCNVWRRVPGQDNIREGQSSGWAIGTINLDDYQGQTILISFQNHSRYDGWYNTYTYLDNMELVITE